MSPDAAEGTVPRPDGAEPAEAAGAVETTTSAEVAARLAELDSLPPAEHVAVYTALHEQLQAALGEIDSA